VRKSKLLAGCAAALMAGRCLAQALPPPRATAEDVVVFAHKRAVRGGGLIKAETAAKSVSTVSSEFIKTQAATQNAYQLVALLPGANVSTSDPYGLSQENSITLRGLGQDEIGYVLEGMPLNDIGYYDGYPAQFIDSENIDEIALAQGSADLSSPVISAAGGLMSLTMLDPSLHPGGTVNVSYGSYHANREFVRLDSGLIGDTGIRAFVSFSHTGADNWRGSGREKRTHVDFKFVKEWGEGNRISWVGTYHDGITTGYPLPTLAQYAAYGRSGLDNWAGHYTPGNGDYWRLNVGTYRLFYTSMPSHFSLTDALALDVTPYWQYGYGNSPYGTPLSTTGNYQGTQGPYTVAIPGSTGGTGTVMADYTGLQYRAGVEPKFTYTIGRNAITAGYWYEYDDETDQQPYTSLSPDGTPGNLWVDTDRGLIRLPNGQILLAGADQVRTQINMLFVGDTFTAGPLTLEAGFKEALVARDGTNEVPGPQYKAVINSAEPLPRLAARYQIDGENQVFLSASTNFRTPSQATLFNAYYGGTIYSAANTNLKSEYSISEELGYRYQGPMLTASAVFFNYNFTNRQIATVVGGNQIAETVNAGGQTSRGVDVEAGTRPWRNFSPYVSGEYLNATIDNDFLVGNDYLPTAGKTAIRSPRLQGAIGLKYDDGRFFGLASVKYVGSQYSTFLDDQKIPAHEQGDLSLGYRLPRLGLAARPEIKLNLINITDANFLSGVANPTPNAQNAIGRHGTLIYGSEPSYYIGGGFAALMTLSQSF
jgi:iron complex outermembrane receptor protein